MSKYGWRAGRLVVLLGALSAFASGTAYGRALSPPLPASPWVIQGSPNFSAPPGPIDLGPSAVGMNTPHAFPTELTITNTGTALLTAPSFTFNPPEATFTAESIFPGTPINIAAGSSRTLGVIFHPLGAGTRTIQFISMDNAPGSPHTVTFTGTGFAVPNNDFAMILDPGSPATVSAARGQTTTFPIWLLSGAVAFGNTAVTVTCASETAISCSTGSSSPFLLAGDGFGPTRQKIPISFVVPAVTASLRPNLAVWWSLAPIGLVLALVRRQRRSNLFHLAVLMLCVSTISCGGNSTPRPITSGTVVLTAVSSQANGSSQTHTLSVPFSVQ
jgi:hypothetical protein